ncbi:hypothetical protein BJF78_22175 [Pseudonocardia sp. CNS-139]|nr:hypothetical protein BJF78_22175 [Pseudonocardia sp. CNS-139]
MSTTSACPACSAPAGPPFVRLGALPVHGRATFATCDEARAVPVGDLELTLCEACGVVFNATFDPALLLPGPPEPGPARPGSRRTARSWHSAGWPGTGCVGRRSSRSAGISVLSCCGRRGERHRGRAGGVRARQHPARDAAVVTRGPSAQVVEGMRAAGTSVLLTEVPDVGRVLAEGAFWDLRYEHRCAFTAETLTAFLGRLGLGVTSARTVHGGRTVVAEASLDAAPAGGVPAADLAGLRGLCEDFGYQAARRIAHWAGWLDEQAAAGTSVAVWGPAAVAFLAVLDGHDTPVAAAVDPHPARQGRHLGGSGLPVVAPADLKAARPARCC